MTTACDTLTPRQAETLAFIERRYLATTMCPTTREIADEHGVCVHAVQGHIEALCRKELLVSEGANRSRGYRPTGVTLPPLYLAVTTAMLTDVELATLNVFIDHYERGISPPTAQEIADARGLASKSGVMATLWRLVRKGLLIHAGEGRARAYYLNRKGGVA